MNNAMRRVHITLWKVHIYTACHTLLSAETFLSYVFCSGGPDAASVRDNSLAVIFSDLSRLSITLKYMGELYEL